MGSVPLKVSHQHIHARYIVFDKDGTLIDFHKIWGPRLVRGALKLKDICALDNNFLDHLYRALGYDPQTGQTFGQGPLATAPLHQFATIVASVLFQFGLNWDEACQLTKSHMSSEMTAAPSDDEIIARGNVRSAFEALSNAGCLLGIATTDNRAATESAIARLGIGGLLLDIRCGDDNGPVKPNIAVLLELAASRSLPLSELIMVGDTVSDLAMAKDAGVGLSVGILGGAGSESQLRPYADVLIESVEEITPTELG